MTSYLIPVVDEPDLFVSASWEDHKDRTPPSGEPGTDYACSTGTSVRAAGDGKVIDRKTSNSGAMGRYVTIALDDGRTTRTLHMSAVWVAVGARVSRGDVLGESGASGNGSDYFYGPHAHQTLWPHGYWDDPTIDFEKYVGSDPTPTPEPPAEEEETMLRGFWYDDDGSIVFVLFDTASGFHQKHGGVSGAYNGALSTNWQTNAWPEVTAAHAGVIESACAAVRAGQ